MIRVRQRKKENEDDDLWNERRWRRQRRGARTLKDLTTKGKSETIEKLCRQAERWKIKGSKGRLNCRRRKTNQCNVRWQKLSWGKQCHGCRVVLEERTQNAGERRMIWARVYLQSGRETKTGNEGRAVTEENLKSKPEIITKQSEGSETQDTKKHRTSIFIRFIQGRVAGAAA